MPTSSRWSNPSPSSNSPAEHRGPDKIFRAAQPGLWRENLSADEQEVVEGVMGPKLRELGYGFDDPSN